MIFTKVKRNRKTYFNQKERQQRTCRSQLREYYKEISSDFEIKYGLKIKRIEFTDEARSNDKIDIAILGNDNKLSTEKINIYKAKESTNLSDKSFQKFIDSGANFPSLFSAKKYQLRLNRLFEPLSNSKGFYFDPRHKISFYLKNFINHISIPDKILKIRLSADGTQIGKNLTVLNISFSFLNVIKLPTNNKRKNEAIIYSPNREDSNFLLGCFKIENENYKETKEALAELSAIFEDLENIELDDNTYKIEYFLGGDLKFIAYAIGVNAAMSIHPCPWCESQKNEKFKDIDGHKPRTLKIEERSKEVGYNEEPIFKFVEMTNIIVDILHLFLRVSDKLFDLLHIRIEQLDLKSKKKSEPKNLNSYLKFIETLKIKKPGYYENKVFKHRNFNGVEQKKIFQNINLQILFPEMENSDIIQSVWDEFYQIIYEVKDNLIKIEDLKTKTSTFLNNFRKIAFKSSITPYIHIFVSHLPRQAEYLGNNNLFINDFSMEGTEKLNDLVTKYYQRSSNKKENFLYQILQKRSRIEILNHHNNLNLILN